MWLKGAEDAWLTAQSLVESKRFHHALFFAQLYLEKLLKALTYYLKDEHPLFTHNLVLLAKKTGVPLNQDQENELREITTFNISARYEDHKQQLYHKATSEFALQWLDTTKKLSGYFMPFFTTK
ncbi:HEPN domain-containing protein [Candidatus Amesbacteria bacterium]|nr:HEPN domain-containing protein [Candidatus Amesbacteria bacterium]